MPAEDTDQDSEHRPIQYIRFGESRRDDGTGRGVPCYEAVFRDDRIQLLTDGIDPVATGRHLAAARSARRAVHMVVGRPLGVAPDGATLLAVGFELPLFAYSIDDVELMSDEPAPGVTVRRPDATRAAGSHRERMVA
ncbi:hypothetical protein STAQ_19050 [Allostella sp. ATCC 35155]|nr:hypothetical protein STAQ_19050 [Stella sp. ATCC 35155]